MKFKMEFKGINEYTETLLKAGVDVDIVAREALAEIGQILQSDMVRRVKVKTGKHSKNIIDHIKIRTPTGAGHYNYVEVGVIHRLEFTDAKSARQAAAVEFGSVHNAAMPFARPAIASKKAALNKLILERYRAAGLAE